MFYVSRIAAAAFTAGILISIALPFAASAVSTTPPTPVSTPEQLPSSPLMITAYQATGSSLSFVQIYNNSSELVDLDGGKLVYSYVSDGVVREAMTLSGLMRPRTHVLLAAEGFLQDHAIAFFTATTADEETTIETIALLMPGAAPSLVPTTMKTNSVIQQRGKTSTGYSTVTFGNFDGLLYADRLYEVPGSPKLQIIELLPRAKNCEPFDNDPTCGDFVKFKTLPSFDIASLGDYRLRSGDGSESVTNTFTLTSASKHGDYVLLRLRDDGQLLSLTNSGGYVWLEDSFGVRRYDESLTMYGDAGKDAFINQSWALDEQDGAWRWAIPSPMGANVFPKVLAESVEGPESAICPAGKYRNPETNRCRSIEEAVSELATCEEGKERNPLTNRCRSTATLATASLTPCGDGEERNISTNRCRKVSSVGAALTPCQAGYERNPATNRCRKALESASALTTPGAVAANDAAKGEVTLQTALIATVGIGAVSYGIYEWRQELGRFFRRAVGVATRK